MGPDRRTLRNPAGTAAAGRNPAPGPHEPRPGNLLRSRRRHQLWVLRQVSNGVALRMAVLYLLLTDGSSAKLYAGDES